jgi:hypothetical protein
MPISLAQFSVFDQFLDELGASTIGDPGVTGAASVHAVFPSQPPPLDGRSVSGKVDTPGKLGPGADRLQSLLSSDTASEWERAQRERQFNLQGARRLRKHHSAA